jgi:hypothetical protein
MATVIPFPDEKKREELEEERIQKRMEELEKELCKGKVSFPQAPFTVTED